MDCSPSSSSPESPPPSADSVSDTNPQTNNGGDSVEASSVNISVCVDRQQPIVPSWLMFVTAISFITRFVYLHYPDEVVFDESHFGKFTNGYCCRHVLWFDIHPPFAKLLLALTAKIIGYHGQQPYDEIGEIYMDDHYIYLRCFPALMGSLMVPVMYYTMRQVGTSNRAAVLASLMVAFDHCILTESRLILTDSTLFLFCQLAFLAYLLLINYEDKHSRFEHVVVTGFRPVTAAATTGGGDDGDADKQTAVGEEEYIVKEYDVLLVDYIWHWKWYALVILSGSTFGMMLAIKWVAALATYGLCGLIQASRLIYMIYWRKYSISTYELLVKGFWLIAAPVGIHVASWWAHFHLLPLPSNAVWFTGQSFERLDIWNRMLDMNWTMYSGSASINVPHHWQSWYYQWPVMYRNVMYWHRNHEDGSISRISLLGNPIIWWIVLLCICLYVFYVLIVAVGIARVRKEEREYFKKGLFMLGGWVLNLVPFIPVTRQCFLYHYVPALVYGIQLFGIVFDKVTKSEDSVFRRRLFKVLSLVFFGSFVFWMPLVYGIPLHPFEYRRRIWFSTWE